MDIATYVRSQHEAFVANDDRIDPAPDAETVHDARVALRRLRSTIRVFALGREELDSELRWYAGLLGDVRDADVLRAHLLESVHRLPVELVLGPVAAQVGEELQLRRQHAVDAVLAARQSARYRDLVDALAAFAALPGEPSRPKRRIERARGKADRRLRAADDDVSLHRARKAVKRARYADEVRGRHPRRWTRIQDRLGEHQDSVYARGVLRELALRNPPSGFTYGLLHEQEAERGRRTAR